MLSILSFFRLYWRGILVGLAIIYLSLAPPSGFEKIPIPVVKGMDKAVHILMYLGLTIACVLDVRFSRKPLSDRIRVIYCVFFPLLLGGILEIVQWKFTTYRIGSWFDMLANVSGIAAGYFLMKLLMYKRK